MDRDPNPSQIYRNTRGKKVEGACTYHLAVARNGNSMDNSGRCKPRASSPFLLEGVGGRVDWDPAAARVRGRTHGIQATLGRADRGRGTLDLAAGAIAHLDSAIAAAESGLELRLVSVVVWSGLGTMGVG